METTLLAYDQYENATAGFVYTVCKDNSLYKAVSSASTAKQREYMIVQLTELTAAATVQLLNLKTDRQLSLTRRIELFLLIAEKLSPRGGSPYRPFVNWLTMYAMDADEDSSVKIDRARRSFEAFARETRIQPEEIGNELQQRVEQVPYLIAPLLKSVMGESFPNTCKIRDVAYAFCMQEKPDELLKHLRHMYELTPVWELLLWAHPKKRESMFEVLNDVFALVMTPVLNSTEQDIFALAEKHDIPLDYQALEQLAKSHFDSALKNGVSWTAKKGAYQLQIAGLLLHACVNLKFREDFLKFFITEAKPLILHWDKIRALHPQAAGGANAARLPIRRIEQPEEPTVVTWLKQPSVSELVKLPKITTPEQVARFEQIETDLGPITLEAFWKTFDTSVEFYFEYLSPPRRIALRKSLKKYMKSNNVKIPGEKK
jgi:hypothetical protein